jgi:S-DNA-T family DNA segregation ATPase FtsK/SpoIIIE
MEGNMARVATHKRQSYTTIYKRLGILCVSTVITLFFSIALLTYHHNDASWFFASNESQHIHNMCGSAGAHAAGLFLYLFGWAAYGVMLSLLFMWYLVLRARPWAQELDRILASWLLVSVISALSARYMIEFVAESVPGGFIGQLLHTTLVRWLDAASALLVLCALFTMCLIILFHSFFITLTHTSLAWLKRKGGWRWLGNKLVVVAHYFGAMIIRPGKFVGSCVYAVVGHMIASNPDDTLAKLEYEAHALQQGLDTVHAHAFWTQMQQSTQRSRVQTVSVRVPTSAVVAESVVGDQACTRDSEGHNELVEENARYQLPSSSLFTVAKHEHNDNMLDKELAERADILEEKLERFGISGTVSAIKQGPVVTLFEYKPAIDSKISKIVALEDDLALALQALSIRIIAPIPGTAVVGFEVANAKRHTVAFADIVQSQAYAHTQAALPLILGKNTVGSHVVADLAKMPHLLIAGSTGSGKSVALNAMLVSLLCKRTPHELKLILIDPKRLEFNAYADIGHLLFPVVTNPKQSIDVLHWVVKEMEARYASMATSNARNIADYNAALPQSERKPYLVVVIDELADLMMTAGRELEGVITRITQMARAAGIHMMVATQRPSVDVITGLIKVNFPSRISFRVTSKVDSRTILDCAGADKLLGRGDMLFLDASDAQLKRVHGAYVSDKEIAALITHIRAQQPPAYLDLAQELPLVSGSAAEEEDVIYQEVLAFLREIDEVSISLLQRKFRIGYNRSARIIDILAARGLIMPSEGGKTRKVIR